VGRGSIGIRHLKNLKSLSYNNIIAFSKICDKNKDEELKSKYGVETFHSLDEVRRAKPDAFIIANPTSEHIKYAEIAMDMNSHIFMEKPISHNLIKVKELKEKVYEKGLVFFFANNFRLKGLSKITSLVFSILPESRQDSIFRIGIHGRTTERVTVLKMN